MLNFLTWAQLDSQCRKQSGNITDSDIMPATRQGYLNSKMMKIYALLDGVNDPWYNRSTTLTAAADQEQLYDAANNAGNITALDATAKTITRNIGVFVAGSIISVAEVWVATSQITNSFIGLITIGGATATFTILKGGITTLSASYGLSVLVLKSSSQVACDISTLYVKDFLSIYDNAYASTPGQIRVFDLLKDANRFYQRSLDVDAIKRIAAYQAGDTVYLFIGSAANALGTISAEYRGKPGLYTDATLNNLIDIPPEVNQMLIDEGVASFLIELGKPIPADVQGRIALFEKRYQAAAADKAQALEQKNK